MMLLPRPLWLGLLLLPILTIPMDVGEITPQAFLARLQRIRKGNS